MNTSKLSQSRQIINISEETIHKSVEQLSWCRSVIIVNNIGNFESVSERNTALVLN